MRVWSLFSYQQFLGRKSQTLCFSSYYLDAKSSTLFIVSLIFEEIKRQRKNSLF